MKPNPGEIHSSVNTTLKILWYITWTRNW